MGHFYSGKPVITDGLILYMDAGNPKSFFSDTWKDLKGSYDGSITDVTQSDGYYEFAEIDEPEIVHSEIEFDSASSWTFSQWQYIPSGSPTAWNAFCGTNLGVNGYWMWHTTGTLFFYLDYYDDSGGYDTYAQDWVMTFPVDEWFNITVSYDGLTSSTTGSMNGDQIIESQLMLWSPRPITSFKFKYVGNNGSSRYFTGRLATFQVWDRKLTQNEILNNFNALKSRFGL